MDAISTIDDVRQALAACQQNLTTARSLPPAAYTDQAVAAWEQRAVFDRGWVGVGRSDRWAPGSVRP